jgi:hypothetical protein
MANRIFRNLLKKCSSLLVKVIPTKLFVCIFYQISYIINRLTIRKIANKYSLKLIDQFKSDFTRKSDTLFILGSGDSINMIDDTQWDEISKHDSVGFNFWLLHKFVPSFYVFEESLDKERNFIFYKNLYVKKDDYKNTPFIVKDIEYKGISTELIPSNLRNNIYLSTEMVIQNTDSKYLEYFFIKGINFIKSKNKKKLRVLLKKSGSLSYLLFLGEALGYKKIVLCGIDLNNSKYFYDRYNIENLTIPINYKNKDYIHPTNERTKTNTPMSEVVLLINDLLLKREGVKLYVGNKISALYPSLDCYFDD